MRKGLGWGASGVLLAALLVPGMAAAQSARGQTATGAPGAPQALPPGHPDPNGDVVPAGPIPRDEPEDEDDEAPLPAGHPSVQAAHPEQAQATAPGVFEPPADTESEDPRLPAGSIAIDVLDAENNPVPHTEVTIGVLHQSVAKGESREHKLVTTDDHGVAHIEGLETGSGIAYRVTVGKDGATFAALPFQLSAQKGEHVGLHVYAVTRSIQDSLIVMQGILFAEVKDDRIQIEEAITVFNLGKIAWVPENIVIKLPHEFTALSAQQSMSDQGVDSVDKVGGRLHGTFAPGRHEIQFRWQLPYAGESKVNFEVGLPPHTAVMRVMAGGSQGVKLSVAGFPETQSKRDAQGARVLVTEKQLKKSEPFESINVTLEGLPTPGSGRLIVTGIAGFGVLFGLFLGFQGANKPGRDRGGKGLRLRLLSDLAELEDARRTGDVGPKTYERARRELIDALARTFDRGEMVAKV